MRVSFRRVSRTLYQGTSEASLRSILKHGLDPIADLRKVAKDLRAIYSNPVLQLKHYLTMSDADQGRAMAEYVGDEFFADWLDTQDQGDDSALTEAIKALRNGQKKAPDLDIDPSYYAKFRERIHYRLDIRGQADSPSFLHMEYRGDIRNQWLVHCTDHADALASKGFTRGVADFKALGLTTYLNDEVKSGGYNFAYTVEDFARYGKSTRNQGLKYGTECVVFRASGIQVWHYADKEPQVIFMGDTARDIIPITQGPKGWQVGKRPGGGPLYASQDIDNVVQWVVSHFSQYRHRLLAQ